MRDLASIFAPVQLDEDIVRIMVLRGQQTPITLENVSVPPGEPTKGPLRKINPKSGEGRLLALGWRLVPVPRLSVACSGAASLMWYNPDCWLVMPPSEAPVKRFDGRREALWWAQEQAGLKTPAIAAERDRRPA